MDSRFILSFSFVGPYNTFERKKKSMALINVTKQVQRRNVRTYVSSGRSRSINLSTENKEKSHTEEVLVTTVHLIAFPIYRKTEVIPTKPAVPGVGYKTNI